MFKSCDYCRHRKKKCVVPSTSPSARCAECEHLDVKCEFSFRRPSLKRRRISQRIAAGLIAWPKSASNSKDGDCQLPPAESGRIATKILLEEDGDADSPVSTSDQYWRHVHPFAPFLPTEMLGMLADRELGDDRHIRILQHCVELACHLSLHATPKQGPPGTDRLMAMLSHDQLSLSTVAGILLLASRLSLDDGLIQRVFDTVQAPSVAGPLPEPILVGTVIAHVWRRLVGGSLALRSLPTDGLLPTYAQSLDSTTFAHHYVRLSHLAVELDQRCTATEREGIGPEDQLLWSRLEYECLLRPVQLPPALLDLRDGMPATPQSVVLHCLQNMLLLSFYSYVLDRPDTLGTLLALRPVPGVLYFLCALARTIFVCPREMLDRWALLADIQATTARIMLRLWHRTQFENCRAILNLWDDAHGRFRDLARQVRQEIGPGPWTVDEIDGYSVFWTFRDLRSLTIEFISPDGL